MACRGLAAGLVACALALGAAPAGAQVTGTGGGVAVLVYGGTAPVVLKHARAFPASGGGRHYVVLIASNLLIADRDVEVDAEERTVAIPEDAQGIVLWIEQGPNRVANGSFWHPALIENGEAVEGDITDHVLLDLETLSVKQIKGRIRLPDGLTMNYEPLRLDIEVNVPVTALAAATKAPAKPVPSPRARPHRP
jgi:hypothetical protein